MSRARAAAVAADTPGGAGDGRGEATRELFLDAAERLFAENGFSATSVRAIAAESGVNLGALHYYWGSKNEMIRAVLERRLAPVLEERKRRIARLEAEAGKAPVDLRALLEAMIAPALKIPGATPEQARLFRRLYGRALGDPSPFMRETINRIFDDASTLFLRNLRRCCPHLRGDEFWWRVNCVLGSLLYGQLNNGRLAHLSGDTFSGDDVEGGTAHLVHFLAAGLMAPPRGRQGTGGRG